MAGAIGKVAVAEVARPGRQPFGHLVPEPPDFLEHLVAVHWITEAVPRDKREAGAANLDRLRPHSFEERVVLARTIAVLANDEEVATVEVPEVGPHVIVACVARTGPEHKHPAIEVVLERDCRRIAIG